MKSKKKRWKVSKIANSARKNIVSLDDDFREEVLKIIRCLEESPFSHDIEKIKGKKYFYRLRIGDYRLYFKVSPDSNTIEIPLFDYRGRIKDKTIQRLK